MTHGASEQQPAAPAGKIAAIILAAGKSTRMKSDLPKVLHEVCGRPMLAFVIEACRRAGIGDMQLVVGFGKEAVIGAFSGEPGLRFVEQREQKGTGHAVSMCADGLSGFTGDLIVIAGDMPMIRHETLLALIEDHRASGSAASIATTVLDDPTGYGRIIRGSDGQFEAIVEQRDCDPKQLQTREVNPSYYCFKARALFDALPKIRPDNAKGEYYITDALAAIRADGGSVRAVTSVHAADAVGINSRSDLAEVAKLMQRRIQQGWMDSGVSIIDPEKTWIDSRATIGTQTVIKPFCFIEGKALIGAGCTIGPFAYIGDGALVDDRAKIGPGVLNAVDVQTGGRVPTGAGCKPKSQVVRRPPVRTGS